MGADDKTPRMPPTLASGYGVGLKSTNPPMTTSGASTAPSVGQENSTSSPSVIVGGATTRTAYPMPAPTESIVVTPYNAYHQNYHHPYTHGHMSTYNYLASSVPPSSPSSPRPLLPPPLPFSFTLSPPSADQMHPPSLAHCAAPVLMPPITSAKRPVYATCPHCRHAVTTRIRYRTGSATWIGAACGCLLAFYVCGCLWPFCCDCTKDVIHHCPVCKGVLSRYQRL